MVRAFKVRYLMLVFSCGLFAFATASAQVPLASDKSPLVFRREIRIPMEAAGPAGLCGWFVKPNLPGKHPLLLLTNSDYSSKVGREMGPGMLLPDALWFVHRGWNVAIILRRGYGTSGGEPTENALSQMIASEQAWDYLQGSGAQDLRAAYRYLSMQPDVDVTRVVAAGWFTGGSAAMWLAYDAPAGLKGIINFSGGWATVPDWGLKGHVHVLPDVIAPAFSKLAASTQVPMIWLYPKSGSQFGLKSAVAAHDAFVAAGGHAELVVLPHAGDHSKFLFDENPAEWGPHVEDFLAGLGLPSKQIIPDPPEPDQKKLAKFLSSSALEGYLVYARKGPDGAFAYSPSGAWGYATGKATIKLATDEALSNCPQQDCKVIDSRQ